MVFWLGMCDLFSFQSSRISLTTTYSDLCKKILCQQGEILISCTIHSGSSSPSCFRSCAINIIKLFNSALVWRASIFLLISYSRSLLVRHLWTVLRVESTISITATFFIIILLLAVFFFFSSVKWWTVKTSLFQSPGLMRILADLNKAVDWMVLILPLLSNNSILFS